MTFSPVVASSFTERAITKAHNAGIPDFADPDIRGLQISPDGNDAVSLSKTFTDLLFLGDWCVHRLAPFAVNPGIEPVIFEDAGRRDLENSSEIRLNSVEAVV